MSPSPPRPRWIGVALRALFVTALLGAAVIPLSGVRLVSPDEDPGGPSAEARYEELLAAHARPRGVDFRALWPRRAVIGAYIAELGRSGPESTPPRFAAAGARLAYYLNAYNALVLYAVLDAWPIDSVHDVGGLISPRPGFGFFYASLFQLDGRWTNLYDLENDVIRARFSDARVHAAINCASRSCPALQPTLFTAADLDRQLDAAARGFCRDARHVRIDDDAREIVLNAIFDWFREDFARDGSRLRGDADPLAFIEHHATDEGRASLERARRAGYRVRFETYDWRINATSAPADPR